MSNQLSSIRTRVELDDFIPKNFPRRVAIVIAEVAGKLVYHLVVFPRKFFSASLGPMAHGFDNVRVKIGISGYEIPKSLPAEFQKITLVWIVILAVAAGIYRDCLFSCAVRAENPLDLAKIIFHSRDLLAVAPTWPGLYRDDIAHSVFFELQIDSLCTGFSSAKNLPANKKRQLLQHPAKDSLLLCERYASRISLMIS